MSDVAETPNTVKIIYEGTREVQIAAEYAQNHEVLKQFLAAQGINGAATAKIVARDDGSLELLKQAGLNGSVAESILNRLQQSAQSRNPAVALAYQIHQQEREGTLTIDQLGLLEETIESAVQAAREQQSQVRSQFGRIIQCRPQPSRSVLS